MNKKMILGLAVILLLVLAGFLFSRPPTGKIINGNTREFTVKAFRFGYSPDLIEVDRGDRVRITIENTDTLHGIIIPELNLRGNEVIEFTADREGEFIWYCAVMCGSGHGEMKGRLIVK